MPLKRSHPSHSICADAPGVRQTYVTLKEVAALAGVSPMTASRSLTRPELVAEATRQRVTDAVEKTGYVPNSLAGGLTSRRTRLIALIVPSIAHSLFSEMTESLIDTLAAKGYETTLGISRYDPLREEAWVAAILTRRPDGILLTGTDHSLRTQRLLRDAGIPVGQLWDYTTSTLGFSVGFCQEKVGHAAFDHLRERGFRRPALIRSDDSRAARRANGFRAAANQAGFAAPAEVVFSETLPQAHRGSEGITNLLRIDPLADAVFCSSDALAQSVIAHAQRLGLVVPERFGVLGFGDQALAANTIPALSSMRIEGSKMGKLAAEQLLMRIEGHPNLTITALDIGFELVERLSTCGRTQLPSELLTTPRTCQ